MKIKTTNEAEMVRLLRSIDEQLATIVMAIHTREALMPKQDEPVEVTILRTMTPKQHVVTQMLCNGRPNKAIADRLGITVSTAKTHVRAMCSKLEVSSRVQVVTRLGNVIAIMEPQAYAAMSGGLPPDWDKNYVEGQKDPYEHIYRTSVERANGY